MTLLERLHRACPDNTRVVYMTYWTEQLLRRERDANKSAFWMPDVTGGDTNAPFKLFGHPVHCDNDANRPDRTVYFETPEGLYWFGWSE